MLFNSFEFLIFLPVVFLLYWFVFRPRRLQNLLVVVASYVFYGWWDWRFLFLIALTSLCSFGSGLLMGDPTPALPAQPEGMLSKRSGERRGGGWRRGVCAANIVLNLGILGVFKYYNFFVENLETLMNATLGYQLDYVTMNIILPVGISFYTFQALSYSIDVYRRKLPATKDIVEFFAYISFFPQLVAGPIERATNLLPQFQRERRFDYTQAVDGCRQMLWGFFKKMVIADNCAMAVDYVWAGYEHQTGFVLLLGALLFTFQIYGDFSGYSDIAIGCARLFGFDLKRNFNFPYFSRNIPDFWRRWHISLMTWFRDYVYFPLGGSRCSRMKTFRNIFVVWGISGLWHGANWTYVIWGLYHGMLLVIYNLLGVKHSDGKSPLYLKLLQGALTFSLVLIGWIIFRAETIGDAFGYMSSMCSSSLFDVAGSHDALKAMNFTKTPGLVLMLVAEWLMRDRQHALQIMGDNFLTRKAWVRYTLYVILATCTLAYAGTKSAFIYFQF